MLFHQSFHLLVSLVTVVRADSGAGRLDGDLQRAPTPKACAALVQARADQYVRSLPPDSIQAAVIRDARTCGRRFDRTRLNVSSLRDAIVLYRNGRMDDELFPAIDTVIARTPAGPARADMIRYYIKWLLSDTELADVPVWATWLEARNERYATMADPSSLDKLALELNFAAAYGMSDPRWNVHADRAARLVEDIPEAQREADEGRELTCNTYKLTAERSVRAGFLDRAVADMDACLALWKEEIARQHTISDSVLIATQDFDAMLRRAVLIGLQRTRRQYTMVDHPAPAILHSPYWLNRGGDTSSIAFHDPVTLVEFTWIPCVNCEKGYPIVRALQERYQSRGMRTVLVTYLQGRTPDADSATTPDELAYDVKYWTVHQRLNVPIAVDAFPPGASRWYLTYYPPLFQQYAITGAPTYYLIDRHGVVRYVQNGHTPDLEARLTVAIEHVLQQ